MNNLEKSIIESLRTAPVGLRADILAEELDAARDDVLDTLADLVAEGYVAVERGITTTYRLTEEGMQLNFDNQPAGNIIAKQVWAVGDKHFDTEAEAAAYLQSHDLELRISAWVEANIPKSHKTWSTHKKVILAWELSKDGSVQ